MVVRGENRVMLEIRILGVHYLPGWEPPISTIYVCRTFYATVLPAALIVPSVVRNRR